MNKRTVLIGAILLIALSFSTFAAMPKTIVFQGRLMNNGVTPVGTGQITFNIYNIPTGGTSLWTETDTVSFDSGVFSVPLGSVTPLSIAFNQPLWVEMTYNGSTLSPRQSLNVSPYSFYAITAETVINGGVPIGTVLASASSIVPAGYLICSGESESVNTYPNLFAAIGYTYGGSGSNFNVPDYRGYFLRGWDMGAGVDPDSSSRTIANGSGTTVGNVIGSRQQDQFKSHAHTIYGSTGVDDANFSGQNNDMAASDTSNANYSTTSSSSGGNETRPKNMYVMYMIRAQ